MISGQNKRPFETGGKAGNFEPAWKENQATEDAAEPVNDSSRCVSHGPA